MGDGLRRKGEFPLINKTRIFISSAYEEDLKGPRKLIKKHLEESGHEVPIFEDGDFGTWEKDTLKQCQDVVKSSDVFVLLINKKSGASRKLLRGNVTPTYLEYKAALLEKKHILVFVSPEIKNNFRLLQKEFKNLYDIYLRDHHRLPGSPFDPLKDWITEQLKQDGIAKSLLEVADPFVWAFLYDIYSNGKWLYDFTIARSEKEASTISAMLSTSLRSVVGLIEERDQLEQLKGQASFLLNYADYTLIMLDKRNSIMQNTKREWSNFLKSGLLFLDEPRAIVQTPDTNPIHVNTVSECLAASLYKYDGTYLKRMAECGEITAPDFFDLTESEDVFVVEAYNNQERLIAFLEEKQTLYITEPIGEYVLCLHFTFIDPWSKEQVRAYSDEIEYAIINESGHFFQFLIMLIGGTK